MTFLSKYSHLAKALKIGCSCPWNPFAYEITDKITLEGSVRAHFWAHLWRSSPHREPLKSPPGPAFFLAVTSLPLSHTRLIFSVRGWTSGQTSCNCSYRQRRDHSDAPWAGGHGRARWPRPRAPIPDKPWTTAGESRSSSLSVELQERRQRNFIPLKELH